MWSDIYVKESFSCLWRSDLSSRGVLPTVMRRCVCSRNLDNEAMAHWGLLPPKKRKKRPLACSIMHSDVQGALI